MACQNIHLATTADQLTGSCLHLVSFFNSSKKVETLMLLCIQPSVRTVILKHICLDEDDSNSNVKIAMVPFTLFDMLSVYFIYKFY